MPGSPLALVLLLLLLVLMMLGARRWGGRGRRNARCRGGVLVDVTGDGTVEIGAGANRGAGRRRWREGETPGIVRLDDFQSISRTYTLSSPQLTQPPSRAIVGVRLDDGQYVALAEGQLVGTLGYVLVDGLGQDFLCRLWLIVVVLHHKHAATATAA